MKGGEATLAKTTVGCPVTVRILNIDQWKQRISLALEKVEPPVASTQTDDGEEAVVVTEPERASAVESVS
jgi:hypothetical protein